jgi:hypothetical protein
MKIFNRRVFFFREYKTVTRPVFLGAACRCSVQPTSALDKSSPFSSAGVLEV